MDEISTLRSIVDSMTLVVNSMSVQLINQTKILTSLLEKCRYCGKPGVTMTHMHLEHIRACDTCCAKLIAMSKNENKQECYNDWVEIQLASEHRETTILANTFDRIYNTENKSKKIISS